MRPRNNVHRPVMDLSNINEAEEISYIELPKNRMKPRNNGHHPTLNLDELKNIGPVSHIEHPLGMAVSLTFDTFETGSPIRSRHPVYSPATLSAKWAAFYDTSKFPANWNWAETGYGNLLDWNRPIDYEKYGGGAKDRAKYGPEATKRKTSSEKKNSIEKHKTSSESQRSSIERPKSKIPVPSRKDKQAENVKYYTVLNPGLYLRSPLGLKQPIKKANAPLKSAMKPLYGGGSLRTTKTVHFKDELPVAIKVKNTIYETKSHIPQPQSARLPQQHKDLHQITKLKNTIIKAQAKLSSIPSPHCMAIRTTIRFKVLNQKIRHSLIGDKDDYVPPVPAKESTWFGQLRFKPAHVMGARLHKRNRSHIPVRTMK